jgi:hypothetical protein
VTVHVAELATTTTTTTASNIHTIPIMQWTTFFISLLVVPTLSLVDNIGKTTID